MPSPLRTLSFAIGTFVVACSATAEVVKLTVEQRRPLANARQPYEKLTGRFTGELDPRLPQNAVVTDIELAPRNARGMVEYSATFTILKPLDMGKATGVLVYQVPNRGRANLEGGGYFGDFRGAGHVLVASGWQADIAAGAGVEAMVAPIARNPDGSSITGPAMARFYDAPAGATTQPIIRGRVTGTATPASLDTTNATFTRRTSEEGARVPIASNAWAFADCSQTPFPGKPDPATFTYAASLLDVPTQECIVVEDAVSGVQAGSAGNFQAVIGVDRGAGRQTLLDAGATLVVDDLIDLL